MERLKKKQEGFRDIFTERAVSLWGDRIFLRLFLAPYNPLSNRACMCMRESEHVFAKSSSRLSPWHYCCDWVVLSFGIRRMWWKWHMLHFCWVWEALSFPH